MRFELEKYSGAKSRFVCPNCKHKGEFTKYIYKETNNYISEIVGICNRVEKCGYHYTPKEYFKNNDTRDISIIHFDTGDTNDTRDTGLRNFDTIPFEKITKTFDLNIALNCNNFVKYLLKIFSDSLTINLIKRFKIGTAQNNYTVFYQIDTENYIRTGKKILYDPDTGKRKGELSFVHKKLNLNYKLEQCFFGLHQLQNNYENIAIFESEKSAILMSVYLENMICLATGGAKALNLDKFEILREKKCKSIILYPDKSFFNDWSEKVMRYSKALNLDIKVSKTLEKSEVNSGDDIADYLNYDKNFNWALSGDGYPMFWDHVSLKNNY